MRRLNSLQKGCAPLQQNCLQRGAFLFHGPAGPALPGSEQPVDKIGQRRPVIIIGDVVDVEIRIDSLVNVIEGAVLQKGHPLCGGDLEDRSVRC